jgi:hypothetical protein
MGKFTRTWALSLFLSCFSLVEADILWSPPSDVSSPDANSLAPQVSIAPAQNASLVWSAFNGSNYVVQTSTSKIGGQWSQPFKLSYIGQNAFFAKVATDYNNNTIALWSRSNGTNFVIQADYKLTHQDWQAPVSISGSSPQTEDATRPQIVIDLNGNATAIWQKYNGTTHVIQAASKPAGENWSKPTNLTEPNAHNYGSFDPQLDVDGAGNVTAIWTNAFYMTQTSIQPFNGVWSPPLSISTPGQKVSSPHIAVNSNGNAAAIWVGNDGNNAIIQSAHRLSNGEWSLPSTLSLSGQDADAPQITIDPQGNIAAIWQRSDGTNTIVQASIQLAGGNWLTPVDLSDAFQDASEAQIKADPSSNILAVWKKSDGTNFIIQVSTSSFNSSYWTSPISLSDTGQDAVSPQIAVNNAGDSVVVWQRGNGAINTIQAAFGEFKKANPSENK